MKIAKKLISLLMLVSALLALCIVASATGGQTNLNAKLSATEAKVGDQITLTISNCDMTAEAIKAGFYFDNTKLKVEKITWSHIVAYSEDEEDDVNNFATSQTSKKKANESGTALGVYAICSGVDSECYEGVIVTVVFSVIAEGEAQITLREETVGTDAFKSDSVETLTITIGGSTPPCEHKDESKYTYASNAGKLTHKVTCDCGEVVTASENCSFNNEGKCTKCGYECLHTNENGALMFTEGKCDLCGYVCRHGEDHMGSSPMYIQMDNGKHNLKTTCDCGVLVEDYIEDCRDEYTYIDDTSIEQPDGICDCCEQEMPCEHSSFRYDINNDGTHTKYCNDCDTPIEGETNVKHTYGDKCTCVCGATNHEYTYACDAHCAICEELTNEYAAHNVIYVEAKAPTCTENGNIEYWYCGDCGSAWLDAECTMVTNLQSVKLGATCATNAIHSKGVEAGCHYTGWTENWYCANCDVYYLDADCTIITNYKSLAIPALQDTAEYVPAKAPTCTEAGNVEYWICYECEQVWADEALTQLTNIKNVQIDKDADKHTKDPVYTYKDAYEHTATYSCCEVTVDKGHKQSEICTDCQAILVRVLLVGEAQIHIVFADKDGNLEIELPASELKRLYMVAANGSTNAGSGLVGDDNIISLTNLTANAVITVLDVYTGTVITNGATMSEQLWAIHEMCGLKQTENGHETFMSATGSAVLSFEHYSKEGFELDYVLVNGTKYELGESCEITADGFVIELVWKCLHTTTEYVDNGNGTHSEVCGTCGEKVGEPDAHAYDTINHKCVCEAVEKFTLTVIDMNSDRHTVSVPFGTNILEFIKAMNGIDISSKKVICDTMIGEYIFAAWVYANGEADVAKDDIVVGNVIIKPMTSANGWMKYQNGWQYHNNGVVVKTTWMEIDGAWYYFDAYGFRAEGLTRVPYNKELGHKNNETSTDYVDANNAWYYFDANGQYENTKNGIIDGKYVVNGMIPWHPGFVEFEGALYYFVGDQDQGGNIMATGWVYATRNNVDSKPVGSKCIYYFGEDGKLVLNNGVAAVDNVLYYFDENHMLKLGAGLVAVEGGYIYVRSSGMLAIGAYYIGDVKYEFDENGVTTGVKNGIIGGKYYVNGHVQYGAGLITYGDGYIYVKSSGEVATGTYWITKTNGLKPAGKYEFDERGNMLEPKDGIVQIDGKLYYYQNNHLMCGLGLIKMDEGYYYIRSNGEVVTGGYWITNTNGLMDAGKYNFGTDGKLITE